MTVIGFDDTDSRTQGMCTTYLATRLAAAIVDAGWTVDRTLLVRLNPAVEHKTRGNAALALHTDIPATEAVTLAADALDSLAIDDDARTSPGLIVAPGEPDSVDDAIAVFARRAMREQLRLVDALSLADEAGYEHRGWAPEGCAVSGRGRIGALAAIGAWRAFDEWTYEQIAYREFDRCGTPREIDADSVFAAADRSSQAVWDTVDRGEQQTVCVPNAPGPILYGIRGDDPVAVSRVGDDIVSESVAHSTLFVTNQGTDLHLADGAIGSLTDGRGYRVDGVVTTSPETRQGGHVFFQLGAPEAELGNSQSAESVSCVAFEPTKRFRDQVRRLRVDDRLTVCGEYDEGTIKLEKFAIRHLQRTEQVTPTCPDCDRRMKSAGRNQGYRCRECGTSAPEKTARRVDRELDIGWYEVPPCARRHIAKPLVRGGFDAPTHPER